MKRNTSVLGDKGSSPGKLGITKEVYLFIDKGKLSCYSLFSKRVEYNMAVIRPFRGLYYNPKNITDLALVSTPPYDIIAPEEKVRYKKKHPCNIIRLILPESMRGMDKYQEAASFLQKWEKEGILVREKNPSIYPYQQIFTSPSGETKKREGFVTLVKLEPLGAGRIIPHEQTTPKPVEDRLKLMEACGANLSQIFALYSDPSGEIDKILNELRTISPRYEFRDDDGVIHRLWQSDEQEIIMQLKEKMQLKPLLIADGHHRYKTALIYRDKMRKHNPSYEARSPFEYTMMYLTPLEGEGILILPTHRLITLSNSFIPSTFYSTLSEYFYFQCFEFEDQYGEKGARGHFFKALDENKGKRHALGLYIGGDKRYLLLTLKEENKVTELLREYPRVLQELDVTLLDGFIVNKLLGLSEGEVGLTKDRDEALENVHNSKFTIAFILNPPHIYQVQKVAAAGEVMPRKSTYFYPKVATGLVIYKILTNEEIGLLDG